MSTSNLRIARETSDTATGRDRRRSERVPHVMDAWLASPTATDPEDRLEVTAMNLSRHGVRFHSKQRITAGTFYVIEVGMGAQQLVSEVRVVSCVASPDGSGFEVGAEFC